MKENKRNFILRSIIKTYLQEQSPVCSASLQDKLNVPASTIRVYLKHLDELGYVYKPHASSGRLPTLKALADYQREQFVLSGLSKVPARVLNDSEFFKLLDELDAFCLVIDKRNVRLMDVLQIKQNYLFLDFLDFGVVLPYSNELNTLFCELIGCDEMGILKVLNKLNLHEAKSKLTSEINAQKVFMHNLPGFYKMCAQADVAGLLGTNLLEQFSGCFAKSQLLEPEFWGFKFACSYHGMPAIMVICGALSKNYEKLFKSLKEEK